MAIETELKNPISLSVFKELFMWRKLTVLLFLLVVAQAATALPIAEKPYVGSLSNIQSTQASEVSDLFKSNKNSRVGQESASLFGDNIDRDDSEDLFNLPRLNRLSPLLFSAEIQTTPNYVLIVEFFKIKLTAGLYKHLANPPVIAPWFEQLPHNSHSSRLSGWKDGNSLYSSRTTYHS